MSELDTKAIVLSSMPIGEYDRRLELLSSDLGRISVFARSSRRANSRLTAASRLFAFGTFKLFQGKDSYNLKDADISEYFEGLASDMENTYYGFYFLELARYFSRENVEALDMLRLLYASLKTLEKGRIPKRLIRCIYELKMLCINGLCPDVSRLTQKGGSYAFAERLGGACLKAYAHVLECEPDKLYDFLLTDEALSEFETLMKRLTDMNLDRQLKSRQMLDALI